MKSKTFEQAKEFYNTKKSELLQILHNEYPGRIDHQIDENYDQVAVWFDGFSLCYQDSDMNGCGKGEPHWSNAGADSGLDELKEILKKDERFQPLIAEDEYWCNEYLNDFIDYFCSDFAEKHDIASYFLCNNMEKYKTGNENFDRIFENSLNGIAPETLTEEEIENQEKWINDNWDDIV